MLERNPGATIVHDPRLFRDTVATVEASGGTPVKAKVGHGFIKPVMREYNAPFAGEVSGHFYFRDFFTCDTGMLPWLLVLNQLAKTGQTLAEAVAERQARVAASDEINFQTPTPAKAYLEGLRPQLEAMGEVSVFDGLDITQSAWRANIRASSNEPLLRLNVEAESNQTLQSQLSVLQSLILAQGATLADH
jgi:phosphomannomutase